MPFLKDTNAPIALFDSGAGGIGVLQEVKKLLPSEQFLYFGDTKNAPYGERTHKEIAALVKSAAATMIPHTKALVLACNTATAVAAEELRNAYPDYPIIGMEPHGTDLETVFIRLVDRSDGVSDGKKRRK